MPLGTSWPGKGLSAHIFAWAGFGLGVELLGEEDLGVSTLAEGLV